MLQNYNKIIYLTFDYELFFKRSGTPEQCLIKPTNALIDLFKKNGIKATFFIDVLYYLRLNENKSTLNDAKKIRNQLYTLIENGHSIELHLHPHWLDAIYNGSQWEFPTYRYYKLQNLPENKITDLFISGVQILNEIARDINPNYKVTVFRAGGFCIMPFEKIKKGFIKAEIKIDSSIGYGMKADSQGYSYDFSNAPTDDYWRFETDPFCPDSNGSFIEIPISTYKRSIYHKIMDRSIKKNEPYGDGKFITQTTKSFLDRFRNKIVALTVETGHKNILKKRIQKSNIINIINHPKNVSSYSFELIRWLANKNYKFSILK
jgi:hypothetical protein